MIARFDVDLDDDEGFFLIKSPSPQGEYVLYEDHLREIKIMQSSIDFWRNACKELGSHL